MKETAVQKCTVSLSNILDGEFARRKPAKRPHREVVGATVVNSELFRKVIQGVKTVAGIKAFLVFSVAAFYFAVVAWYVRPDELMAYAEFLGSGFKERGDISF